LPGQKYIYTEPIYSCAQNNKYIYAN